MLFTYAPADAEPRTWQIKLSEISSEDAEAIEDATGWTFVEWQQKFLSGSARAMRVLLWVLLRRDQPKLRFEDLKVAVVGDMQPTFEPHELARLREELERTPEIDPAQKRFLLRVLEEEQAQQAGRTGDPKAQPATATPTRKRAETRSRAS